MSMHRSCTAVVTRTLGAVGRSRLGQGPHPAGDRSSLASGAAPVPLLVSYISKLLAIHHFALPALTLHFLHTLSPPAMLFALPLFIAAVIGGALAQNRFVHPPCAA